MRISVVTPNFNMGHLLEQTIQSVLQNLAPADEYFVIDGGSKDHSVDVIRRYAQSLTGWVSEPDGSYAEAIAKGFARSTGDILCWINCGDVLLDGALSRARSELASGNAELIFGSDFYIDGRSNVIRYSHGAVRNLRDAMLYAGWSPLQDACFWRRSLYDRAGGLDASIKYAADYDLFLRMALAGEARSSPYTYSAFRQHDGQKSLSGAARYAQEKAMVRRRELARLSLPGLQVAWRQLWQRVRMSARARTYPTLYRRADLEGRPIASLAADIYWPKGATAAN